MEAMNKKAQQGTPDLPMKTMKTAQSQWFEPVVTAEKRTLQLFCFPYAGGDAQVFRPWQRHFSSEVSLWLVHLPGRGRRIAEPPFKSLNELVKALADAMVPTLWKNYGF
jgi:surfactin synthase thioesterase subunit